MSFPSILRRSVIVQQQNILGTLSAQILFASPKKRFSARRSPSRRAEAFSRQLEFSASTAVINNDNLTGKTALLCLAVRFLSTIDRIQDTLDLHSKITMETSKALARLAHPRSRHVHRRVEFPSTVHERSFYPRINNSYWHRHSPTHRRAQFRQLA